MDRIMDNNRTTFRFGYYCNNQIKPNIPQPNLQKMYYQIKML